MEYICLKKASEYNNDNPYDVNITSFYKKYKSKIILGKNKNEANYF